MVKLLGSFVSDVLVDSSCVEGLCLMIGLGLMVGLCVEGLCLMISLGLMPGLAGCRSFLVLLADCLTLDPCLGMNRILLFFGSVRSVCVGCRFEIFLSHWCLSVYSVPSFLSVFPLLCSSDLFASVIYFSVLLLDFGSSLGIMWKFLFSVLLHSFLMANPADLWHTPMGSDGCPVGFLSFLWRFCHQSGISAFLVLSLALLRWPCLLLW